MNEVNDEYQQAQIIFVFWKFAIQKATDGSGAVWLIFRLLDGDEDLRVLTDIDGNVVEKGC